MERRDLFDDKRNFTGKTILKGEDVPQGYYYQVVIIVMENTDGRFLIQKRTPKKDGKWASTGGHPKSGETSYEGVLTEVKEEIGLDISNENVKLILTVHDHKRFCDLYYVKMDIDLNKIICQEEEVEDIKLATLDEIKEMIKENTFHQAHSSALFDVLEEIKKGENNNDKVRTI